MASEKKALTPYEKRLERALSAGKRFEEFSRLENVTCGDLAKALGGEFGPAMDERFGSQVIRKGLWAEALALAFHPDPHVAFRASWALEWAYFHDRELFVPHIPDFIENYLRVRNPSAHRHYTKMLCDMMRRGVFDPDTSQAEQVAEKTFDLLISPGTKSAVRVWSAEILYELSSRLEWVGEHLEGILRHQMATMPTPAILSHYRKVLKKMASGRRK